MNLRRSFFLFIPVIAVLVVVFVLTRADQGAASQAIQHPVSAGQMPELFDLVQRDQFIRFESRVTGDFSEYPSIYYNDPDVRMHEDYKRSLSAYGDEALRALDALGVPRQGGDTGYLTAVVASLLSGQANMDAWEEEQKLAAVGGRVANFDNLPEAFIPIERPSLDDWVGSPLVLFDVMVGERTASAKVASGNPRAGGQVLLYEFVNVDGRWFISYMESTWSQGDSDYLN